MNRLERMHELELGRLEKETEIELDKMGKLTDLDVSDQANKSQAEHLRASTGP